MPVFALKYKWRSVATVFVEADDETQAMNIFEESHHLPDADEVDDQEITGIAQSQAADYSPDEVISKNHSN